MRTAPAVSCAKECTEEAHTSIQVQTGSNPAFPAQWFYGLFRALPGDEFVLSPSLDGLKRLIFKTRLGRRPSVQLDTSNGCQDHTVLPYATASLVLRGVDRSRHIAALRIALARDAVASTASRTPRIVTIAIRPSASRRDGADDDI